MLKEMDKDVKQMDAVDIVLIKLAVAATVLFVITVWPAAMDLVHSISWKWFLAAAVIFAIRPFKHYWID